MAQGSTDHRAPNIRGPGAQSLPDAEFMSPLGAILLPRARASSGQADDRDAGTAKRNALASASFVGDEKSTAESL